MSKSKPLYSIIAEAGYTAKETHVETHRQARQDLLEHIARNLLPRGSGFDCGTKIEVAHDKRVELSTSFHHMHESGCYDGWTEHKVVVTPSLFFEIDIRVTGLNRNGIKDYIAETFHYCLTRRYTITAVRENGERGTVVAFSLIPEEETHAV